MPRKRKQDATLAELEAAPLEPKKPRKKASAISEPLAEIVEQYGLKPASELPRQLEPATEIEARHPEQEPPPERPHPPMNGKLPHPEETRWRDKVRKPSPVPQGFMNVDSYPEAGIKVNKSLDRNTVAIQFHDDQVPSRAEKDLMETQGIAYDPGQKQWVRYDKESPGANLLDAKRIGNEIAEDRMQMISVMGR